MIICCTHLDLIIDKTLYTHDNGIHIPDDGLYNASDDGLYT